MCSLGSVHHAQRRQEAVAQAEEYRRREIDEVVLEHNGRQAIGAIAGQIVAQQKEDDEEHRTRHRKHQRPATSHM